MKRKKFLKTVSLISLGAMSLPKIFKANTNSSTVEISDECVQCDVCVDESPSEMIIEQDDDYIYNSESEAFSSVTAEGKTATLNDGYYEEWEYLKDICPASAIIEAD